MSESQSWEIERRCFERLRKYDGRSEFERDYARVVHSSAFRRLQSKTQVFGMGDGDFYRTRLTHSLEVQQIAQSIRGVLAQKEPSKHDLLPAPALLSTICLAHDIGHPPFGHSGEAVLDEIMRDFGGFEGNAQTFRILTRLEKYHFEHGMNLTRRALLGVLKYPFIREDSSDKEDDLKDKFIYEDDKEALAFVLGRFSNEDQERLTTKDVDDKAINMSIDANIMDLADEIAYTVHDLEDAIVLKRVQRDEWEDFQRNHSAFIAKITKISPNQVGQMLFGDNVERKRIIGAFVNAFVTSVKLKRKEVFDSDVLDCKLELPPEMAHFRKALGDFTYEVVFQEPVIKQLEHKGKVLITGIFSAIVGSENPLNTTKIEGCKLLPKTTQKLVKEKDDYASQVRVICDYISGMTDMYATDVYSTLYTPGAGSMFRTN